MVNNNFAFFLKKMHNKLLNADLLIFFVSIIIFSLKQKNFQDKKIFGILVFRNYLLEMHFFKNGLHIFS